MNKEHNSQFERDKMKYRIFIQKNDVSTAMTQLFVTTELKEKFIETIRLFETGLGTQQLDFMQKVADTFHLILIFTQVHLLDDDFVNKEITGRLKINARITLDEIKKALDCAIENTPFQFKNKIHTRASYRIRLNLLARWLTLISGTPFERRKLLGQLRWDMSLRELSERNCAQNLF